MAICQEIRWSVSCVAASIKLYFVRSSNKNSWDARTRNQKTILPYNLYFVFSIIPIWRRLYKFLVKQWLFYSHRLFSSKEKEKTTKASSLSPSDTPVFHVVRLQKSTTAYCDRPTPNELFNLDFCVYWSQGSLGLFYGLVRPPVLWWKSRSRLP